MDRRNLSVGADVGATQQPGLPPSNAQIEQVLESTKAVLEREGRGQIIQSLEAVIEDTKVLLHEKNADQKIQRFILLCTELSQQAGAEAANVYGSEKETLWKLQKRSSDVAANLQNAVTQIISSSEFRNLLVDFLGLLRDAVKEEIRSRDPGLGTGVAEATSALKQKTLPSSASVGVTNASPSSSTTTPTSKSVTQVASETKEKLQAFVSEISSDFQHGTFGVSDRTKEALDARFREILGRIGSNANFRRATLALLDLGEDLVGGVDSFRERKEPEILSKYELTLNNLKMEGFNIIAEFTGKPALEKWNRDLWNLLEKFRNDPQLSRFFSDISSCIRDILQRPDRLQQQFYINQSQDLVHRGFRVWEGFRDKKEVEILLSDTQNLLFIIQNDPSVRRLVEDTNKLTREAFIDDRTGQPSLTVTKETLDNLKRVIIPLILENVKNISIGRIEGYEEDYWFSLAGVAFSAKDLLPENVFVKFEADMSMNLKHLETKEAPAYLLRIELRNINTHFHNVHFRFIKSSFPKMEDEGYADVDISGITLVLRWFSAPSTLGGAWAFGLKRARCHIYDVNIHIKSAHHDVLLPMFGKFYEGTVRRQLEKVVESNLSSRMDSISNDLNNILNQRTSSVGIGAGLGEKIQHTLGNVAGTLSQRAFGPK